MDFTNRNLAYLGDLFGYPVYLTQTLLSTWIVMGILILLAIVVRIKLKHFTDVPGKFQNAVESVVEIMRNFTESTMGKGLGFFSGYFFSIFAFILLSNYISMVGLRPPTADLATTAALALSTFAIIHGYGFIRGRGKYFKGFLEPTPIFLPLNIIGELAKPISLSFRLFGNMLGGVIILGLVYEMFPLALKFIVPSALHAYFDVFAGALQAFIFTVLSMTFISQQVTE